MLDSAPGLGRILSSRLIWPEKVESHQIWKSKFLTIMLKKPSRSRKRNWRERGCSVS